MIKFNKKRGFTLVEMMVAVGLFTLIASISLGAILNIFDANRRSRSTKTVVDNLNFSIENMTRTIRFGNDYHCGTSGDLEDPRNCSNGDTTLAVQFGGNTIVYRFCGSGISWANDDEDSCSDMTPITSSDTVIEDLKFYVFNATDSPSLKQPYVVIAMRGYVGNKPTAQSKFSIQTVVSQRILDL